MNAPRWPVAFLHLAALWAFAFVQPLLDLLGHNSDFFVARGNTSGDILWFALGLVLVPPALLLAVELAAGAVSRPARVALHTAFVAVLAASSRSRRSRPRSTATRHRSRSRRSSASHSRPLDARAATVRSFVTLLSPAPVVFLALFLVFSPVSELLRPAAAVASATGPPAKTPVVLVLFDELPAISLMGPGERIDAARFPAFGRLARDATWYPNATTVSDSTTLAVPAILSGLRPGKTPRLPTSRSYRTTSSRCSVPATTNTSSSRSRTSARLRSAPRARGAARRTGSAASCRTSRSSPAICCCPAASRSGCRRSTAAGPTSPATSRAA